MTNTQIISIVGGVVVIIGIGLGIYINSLNNEIELLESKLSNCDLSLKYQNSVVESMKIGIEEYAASVEDRVKIIEKEVPKYITTNVCETDMESVKALVDSFYK